MRRLNLLFVLTLLSPSPSFAQKDWHLKDPATEGIYGVNMAGAYAQVKDKKPQQVIVAVIDIGTDINHKDLKPLAWVNEDEIEGNGIDDDKNGYIDDVHGWNFLGGKKDNIMYEATEETRMYQTLKEKLDKQHAQPTKEQLEELKSLEQKYLKEQRERESDARFTRRLYRMNRKLHWKIIFRLMAGKGANRQITQGAEMSENNALYNAINADSMRMAIVGDNPHDPYEHNYGNNNVVGPESSHGTHVAGIVASVYYNGRLPKDSDSPLRIMVLRAVPWGDERDKDVANAIRYAVDNGASVINMSFGKTASPYKEAVDAAVKYAMEKDVLLIHGAGNEGVNTDSVRFYPIRSLENGTLVPNWIEVGATGRKGNEDLVASFSNYGKTTVDIFAPGVNIYSTLPNNKYGYESGTSMAAPVVAGVAAWIRSYFPQLKAAEVKIILLHNVTVYSEPVEIPGKRDKQKLNDLSISGGVVNAAKAAAGLMKTK